MNRILADFFVQGYNQTNSAYIAPILCDLKAHKAINSRDKQLSISRSYPKVKLGKRLT